METRVVVDAGHGGWDNGAMFNGRKEKDDNLNLALAVGDILKNNGIDVVFTRTDDVYQSPNEKARIANRANADFFVSLHRNSSPEPNQYIGVQTLLYNDGDIKEVMADTINQQLEQVGFKNLGRSIRKDLAVLRGTNMPAVLVETGFINNDADNQLFDREFDNIAQGIAQGILTTIEQQMPVYRIQIGLFRNYDNAQRLARRVEDLGYTVEIREINGYYAVLVGRFTQLDRAEQIQNILHQDGFDTVVIALR